MPRILKYQLPKREVISIIQMAKLLQFLSVQLQNGIHTIWAIVDEDAPKEAWKIHRIGTGWDTRPELHYIGTIQDGEFVWHYFAERV